MAATVLLSLQACGGPAQPESSPPGAAAAASVAPPARPSPAPAGREPRDRAVTRPAPEVRVAAGGDPVEVRLPRLGIATALDPLHLGRAGELVPPAYGRGGWYERGPEPGEPGRAVIAGHVDSRQGPDVFWNLRSARAGDRIVVAVAGGRPVRFVVQSIGLFPRADFPSDRVYGGPGRVAELRLITCGGAYDRSRGGYQDNVVVFAKRA